MGRERADEHLLERLKLFVDGAGSASANSTVRSWVKRMEEGDPEGVSEEDLDELIRALTLISLARNLYGLDYAFDGFQLDVVTPREGAMLDALKLKMEISETLVQDEALRRRLSASRAVVSGKVLGELEDAFARAFSA